MAGSNGAMFPVRGAEPGIKVVCLTATGTDGNDLTIVEGTGITSVARTGEGKYTVTFNNFGTKILFAHGVVATAVDAVGKNVEVKTITLAGTGTILIETWTRATDTTAAAQADVVATETLRMIFVFGTQD